MILRRRELAPILAASTAVVLAASGFAVGVYLPAFNNGHTAIEGVAHPATSLPPTPGLARRVVFVVLDGLKVDLARELPELARLRRNGVFRTLIAEPPTFTGPQITAMMAGLDPRDSGVRLNGPERGVAGMDTVTDALAAAQVPMEVDDEGFPPFARLLRVPESTTVISGRVHFFAELVQRGLGLFPPLPPVDLKSPVREVTFVHIEDIDEAGHKFGGTSDEYVAAAHHAGHLVERIAQTLDFDQDALIAVSDHGHRPRGGHGGVEPEVTAAFFLGVGAIFRRGVELGPRPMRDVAPTVSVVAGVHAPTSSLGRPMIDALSIDDPLGSVLLAGPFDQTAHFLCALHPGAPCGRVDALVPRLAQGRDPEALAQAEALLDGLGAAREQALEERATSGARLRGGIAALLGATALGFFAERARRFPGRKLGLSGWVAPLIFAATYAALMFGRGYRPSFSTLKAGFSFGYDAAPRTLLAAAVATVFAALVPPGRFAPWLMLLSAAVPYAILAAAVGADPAAVPPAFAGPLVLVLGPGVIGAAVAAVAMSILAAVRAHALSTSGQTR